MLIKDSDKGRKVMIFKIESIQQKKLFKYRKYIGNSLPQAYIPVCKDFISYDHFTESGIAKYLYDNYGFGTFQIRAWKIYHKCGKCKLSLKDYSKYGPCPRCNHNKRIKFKGFYVLCTFEILKRERGFVYNTINISSISRNKFWRLNLKRNI